MAGMLENLMQLAPTVMAGLGNKTETLDKVRDIRTENNTARATREKNEKLKTFGNRVIQLAMQGKATPEAMLQIGTELDLPPLDTTKFMMEFANFRKAMAGQTPEDALYNQRMSATRLNDAKIPAEQARADSYNALAGLRQAQTGQVGQPKPMGPLEKQLAQAKAGYYGAGTKLRQAQTANVGRGGQSSGRVLTGVDASGPGYFQYQNGAVSRIPGIEPMPRAEQRLSDPVNYNDVIDDLTQKGVVMPEELGGFAPGELQEYYTNQVMKYLQLQDPLAKLKAQQDLQRKIKSGNKDAAFIDNVRQALKGE